MSSPPIVSVLCLPARHPYMAKLNRDPIRFVNPGTDYLEDGHLRPDVVLNSHPANSYDVAHLHFSYDRTPTSDLESFVGGLRERRKAFVWTCHSLVSNWGSPDEIRRFLYHHADEVITPTQGCKRALEQRFGLRASGVRVAPLGYMLSPREALALSRLTERKRDRLLLFLGEDRPNKGGAEFISRFLSSRSMKAVNLHVVLRGDSQRRQLGLATIPPNVLLWTRDTYTNYEVANAFLSSSVVVLPYLWGTHSGQIELARDCGAHVVATDVGYFKEQNPAAFFVKGDEMFPTILTALSHPSPTLAGFARERELEFIIQTHLDAYHSSVASYQQRK